jgi:hypothetical protein
VTDTAAKPPLTAASSRRSVRRWVSAAVVVALLAAIAVHFTKAQAELSMVRRLSVGMLAATSLLQLVSQVFLNLSFLLPLQRSVTRLGFWELYLVRMGGFFVSSLVPVAGGIGVRLAYLRGRGVGYLEFTWATLLSNVLALAAAAVLGAAATAVLWATAGPLPRAVLAVSAGLVALSAGVIAAFEYLPRWAAHPGFRRWRWLAGMRELAAGRALTSWVLVFSLVRHALNFVTFGLLYQALSDAPAGFLAGGLVYALTSPVRMVNITPGNLGVTEWFVALVGSLVAFDVATGLIVSLAFRGVALVGQGAGAAFGSAWLALRSRASG